jgi:hypothetical protein
VSRLTFTHSASRTMRRRGWCRGSRSRNKSRGVNKESSRLGAKPSVRTCMSGCPDARCSHALSPSAHWCCVQPAAPQRRGAANMRIPTSGSRPPVIVRGGRGAVSRTTVERCVAMWTPPLPVTQWVVSRRAPAVLQREEKIWRQIRSSAGERPPLTTVVRPSPSSPSSSSPSSLHYIHPTLPPKTRALPRPDLPLWRRLSTILTITTMTPPPIHLPRPP